LASDIYHDHDHDHDHRSKKKNAQGKKRTDEVIWRNEENNEGVGSSTENIWYCTTLGY
jgi:hypothetical protein